MGKSLYTYSSRLETLRSMCRPPRVPCYAIILDFPDVDAISQGISSMQVFNRGKEVTILSLIQHFVHNVDHDIILYEHLPDSVQDAQMLHYYLMGGAILAALKPLINQRQFELLIIGAEFDEKSESLCVWVDDAENPSAHHR